MFVSVAVPVAVMLTPMLPVAFTVNVVLITAAWALAHTSRAKAKLENVRFIGLLESSTRETQEYGEIQLMQHSAAPPFRRADLKSLHRSQVPVYPHPIIFG